MKRQEEQEEEGKEGASGRGFLQERSIDCQVNAATCMRRTTYFNCMAASATPEPLGQLFESTPWEKAEGAACVQSID